MRLTAVLTLALVLVASAKSLSRQPGSAQSPRPLTDAMTSIYALDHYTVFDWITGRYEKGTLTLEGFAARPEIKDRAERAAKATAGIDTVTNRIELLPALQGDDTVRVRAYVAIYGHPALSRYSPGGSGAETGGAIRELQAAENFGIDASTQFRGPHGIHIIVSGARVQLLGSVGNAQDRQTAEVQVRTVSGVLGVTNKITVRARSSPAPQGACCAEGDVRSR